MGALSDPIVGEVFADEFVCAFQQVGDFRAVSVGGKIQKNGGNVASHFLTPDGHVIHSVTGPVSAEVLLSEAHWALDMYGIATAKTSQSARMNHIAWAHQQASWNPASGQDKRVHELLMNQPLPHLKLVYEEIFEDILGQKVSKAGPRLIQAKNRLAMAKHAGRPILFVLHEGTTWQPPTLDPTLQLLMEEYVVVIMPLKEGPALSQLTKQPPFEARGSARPLFVVANSDCVQLHAIAGVRQSELIAAMAEGWASALEANPPSSLKFLVRAQRVLRKVSPTAADRIRNLTIKVQEEARQKRAAEQAKPEQLAMR